MSCGVKAALLVLIQSIEVRILAGQLLLPFGLMAGHMVLVHAVEVRILQGQLNLGRVNFDKSKDRMITWAA